MINASKSYETLKIQIQHSLDFALLCCYAVPALKGYIKAAEGGEVTKIPDPDYFKLTADNERLKEIAKSYRKILGRFLVLSSFSYFESYVDDIIEETLEFNGGIESFLESAKVKRSKVVNLDPDMEILVKKLREYKDNSKNEKYRTAVNILADKNYRFPSELFSVFGLMQIQEKCKNLKSADIPHILNSAFGIELTDNETQDFNNIRVKRNDIAHGNITEVDLSEAIKINRFLRKLAIKIDKYFLIHFFIIESFT